MTAGVLGRLKALPVQGKHGPGRAPSPPSTRVSEGGGRCSAAAAEDCSPH